MFYAGKIGVVGGRLGKAGVNIRFMSVAPIEQDSQGTGSVTETADGNDTSVAEKEALMILGVDKAVPVRAFRLHDTGLIFANDYPQEDIRKSLLGDDGVLEASEVIL